MIKRLPLYTLLFLFGSYGLSSAQNYVKVEHIKKENIIYLTANNTTEKDYEYKFEFTLENLKMVDMIEKIKIPAGEARPFAILALTDQSKSWKFNYKYWHYRYFEGGIFKEIAKTLQLSIEEAENSIIVFDKDGCSRCDKTLNYLESKKIKHHVLNITENKDNAQMMNGYASELGLNLTTITTPMILMGGTINFNISDLDGFLFKMKKFAKEKGLK
ncbi:MAG: glutaredoxin [Roseivirga sp.]|jgi:glutaredoxin